MAHMSSRSAYLAPEFIAMAHRGGALYSPNLGIENTLQAFRNALDLGFRYLETDVHSTADGQLVAFHDSTLERVTGFEGDIGELTLEQAQEVLVGGSERIPTLDEVFEELPDAMLNLDLKEAGAVEPLVETIRRHRAQDRVCIGSFSLRRINRFRRRLGSVPTAVSTVGATALALLGLGRLPGPGNVVFQVPLTHRVGALEMHIVTPKTIRAAHQAGRKVHVWTIDDPEVMHELIDWGVDGIITDRPDLLKGVLRTRGMWSTQE